MEPKVGLSTAWAERLNFNDKDLFNLFDIDIDNAVPVGPESFNCPRCRNSDDDSNFQFYVYKPATSPTTLRGTKYIGCVCGTVYCFGTRMERGYPPLDDAEEGSDDND